MNSNRKLQLFLMAIGVFTITSCKKQGIQDNAPATRNESAMIKTNALPNYSLNNWMSFLPDTMNIAQISIPGTHDSGARTEPISGTAKCQTMSITEQLNAGVRYLDIRCRHINNSFAIHHGAIYQNLNYSDVLKACIDFLNANPSETIMMSVKEEHTAADNTRSFEQTFDSYVQENAGKWDLGTGISKLSAIRGKIKLLRRFGSGNAKGIDATQWGDNTTFDINNPAANLKVQDEYKVSNTDAKWTRVKTQLDAAHADHSNRLYLNYSSGYKSLIFGIPDINAVHNSVNPKIAAYFSGNISGRYGVIPMDFVTTDLARGIVKTNFGQTL